MKMMIRVRVLDWNQIKKQNKINMRHKKTLNKVQLKKDMILKLKLK